MSDKYDIVCIMSEVTPLNLVAAQMGAPICGMLRVCNRGDRTVGPVKVVMSSKEGLFEDWSETIDEIAPGREHVVDYGLSVEYDLEAFRKVKEGVDVCKHVIKVLVGDEEVLSGCYEAKCYPPDIAFDIKNKPEWLAAFVQPSMNATKEILRKAGQLAKYTTGEASLSGYQVNREIVKGQVEAVYNAVRECRIAYANPPKDFAIAGFQKVRMADEILKYRLATCLDSAILFCSLFEEMGLHAVLFLVHGHAFAGVYLKECFAKATTPEEFRSLMRQGDFVAIETTLCNETGIEFAKAVEVGAEHLDESHAGTFECAVDIKSARSGGVNPLSYGAMQEKKVTHEQMYVYTSLPASRQILVCRKMPPEPGKVWHVTVPPDDELLVPYAKLKKLVEIEVAVINDGDGEKVAFSRNYLATHLKVREGIEIEFKSSCFVNPATGMVDGEQPKTIAKTIASFMNGNGGTLFVGVDDNGTVRHGIEADLKLLAANGDGVAVDTPQYNDKGNVYKANADQLSLKLHAIVRGYLGSAAEAYLGECTEFGAMGKLKYVTLRVKSAPDDVIVYYHKTTPKGTVEEIYVRNGAAKKDLLGVARDRFVQERVKRQMRTLLNTMAKANPTLTAGQVADAVQQAVSGALAGQTITGQKVNVSGAVVLTDEGIKNIKSPASLVVNDEHFRDVKSWKDAYLAVLEHLQVVSPEKMDHLPEHEFFKKYFIWPVSKKKYKDYYPTKFGKDRVVRAKEMSGNDCFANSDKIVHRLVRHFGMDPSAFALTAKP